MASDKIVIRGARIALGIGLIADGIAGVVGVILGLVSGFYSGKIDSLIMRLMDIMLAFPYLLLALIVVAVLGPSLRNAMTISASSTRFSVSISASLMVRCTGISPRASAISA